MKRSRLKLFKTTSLTISLIGIILILLTLFVVGYIFVSGVTNSVSTTVNSGASYDDLNQLKMEYNNLSQKYTSLNQQLGTMPDANVKTMFNNGKIKLSESNQTLTELESDIGNGKSDQFIKNKISQVREELKEAEGIYNNITASK
ncbi:hypothetical protein [Methanosphaera sp. WGK6]|uniref:hypothetical protein n=1 Tax=Methanosphaera sp. WGK6 TaxID=1561964 RepID=UPI00084CA860|nr:hypothetical protein [Methanosphaera sp. WGK6]